MYSSPAIGADGTIYVGSEDYKLYAINPDGTEKWRFAAGRSVHSSPAIGVDGIIYVGAYDNNLYAIHSSSLGLADSPWPMFRKGIKHTGNSGRVTEKWSLATGGYVKSSPAIRADGTIFVGSNDNNLYAINPDGTERWIFAAGDCVSGGATVVQGIADGKRAAAGIDKHLRSRGRGGKGRG